MQAAIPTPGGKQISVRVEGDGGDYALMRLLEDFVAGGSLPYPCKTCPTKHFSAAGDEPFPIGAEGDVSDRVLMRQGNLAAGGSLPYLR